MLQLREFVGTSPSTIGSAKSTFSPKSKKLAGFEKKMDEKAEEVAEQEVMDLVNGVFYVFHEGGGTSSIESPPLPTSPVPLAAGAKASRSNAALKDGDGGPTVAAIAASGGASRRGSAQSVLQGGAGGTAKEDASAGILQPDAATKGSEASTIMAAGQPHTQLAIQIPRAHTKAPYHGPGSSSRHHKVRGEPPLPLQGGMGLHSITFSLEDQVYAAVDAMVHNPSLPHLLVLPLESGVEPTISLKFMRVMVRACLPTGIVWNDLAALGSLSEAVRWFQQCISYLPSLDRLDRPPCSEVLAAADERLKAAKEWVLSGFQITHEAIYSEGSQI